VQLPAVAGVTVTTWAVRAVTGTAGLAVLVLVLVTVTQEPTVTLARVAGTVRVNLVVALKLTVTWPSVGFCTCALLALTAATVPEVPAGACPTPDTLVAPAGLLDGLALAEVLAEPPPPQAVRAASNPTARTGTSRAPRAQVRDA